MIGETTAQLSDTPVPPGARMLMDAGRLVTAVSVVLASGAGSVFFTRGDGSVY
jgi:altronate dehydratase